MSGELATDTRTTLGYGPKGASDPTAPFNHTQLTRLDEALTLASAESGIPFSAYVGELSVPTRAAAEELFTQLSDDAVLIAVSPAQRNVHVVTGAKSSQRLPNRACALAALTMRASFSQGDIVGGLVNGLRQLAEAAS